MGYYMVCYLKSSLAFLNIVPVMPFTNPQFSVQCDNLYDLFGTNNVYQ